MPPWSPAMCCRWTGAGPPAEGETGSALRKQQRPRSRALSVWRLASGKGASALQEPRQGPHVALAVGVAGHVGDKGGNAEIFQPVEQCLYLRLGAHHGIEAGEVLGEILPQFIQQAGIPAAG